MNNTIELITKQTLINETNKEKIQIQIKGVENGQIYSRSFTVRGLSVDYLFSLFLMIIGKMAETPLNQIKVTCYKPEIKENDNI